MIIGTAGHVDHGKSLLVEALTGINPDRLAVEKARGMTIDLGFAQLTLPSGRTAGIVDVPGHERFIKNMLAGAGGIDLALLVVAADDGVMPQTREHLAILDLLDVRRGVVALTKCDLAADGWLDAVEAEVGRTLDGTTLEGSPVVRCSAVTRDGLDLLARTLDSAIEALPPKRDTGRPRLSLDRVFTAEGFGTVVTGTLLDGQLTAGQELEALPGGFRGRVRGLQSHNASVERALPGTRTAVNVTGIAREDLRRGVVLTTPGWLRPTDVVDVRLRAVGWTPRPLRHGMAVTFHSGAAETSAKLRLLEAPEILPGQTAWAQVKLATPVAVVRRDRFVLRTPNDTVAGGVIADTAPKRHRRGDPAVLAALEAMLSDAPEDAVLAEVARRPLIARSDVVGDSGLGDAAVNAALDTLIDAGTVLDVAGHTALASFVDDLRRRARHALDAYHAAHSLRPGMPLQELRERLGLDSRLLTSLVATWPETRATETAVALTSFAPAPDASQQAQIDAYLSSLRDETEPPAARLDPELLAYLVDRGDVVDAGDGTVFDAHWFAEQEARVRDHIFRRGSITLAEARDLLGTGRRRAQALLEEMDRRRVTRRVGDKRVLRASGEK